MFRDQTCSGCNPTTNTNFGKHIVNLYWLSLFDKYEKRLF